MDNVPDDIAKRLENVEERIAKVEREIAKKDGDEKCPHCGEVLETGYMLGINGERVKVCQYCGEEVDTE